MLQAHMPRRITIPRRSARLPSPPFDALASQPAPSRKNLTKRQLAQELICCIRTLDEWVKERKIPVKRLTPRMLRFDLDAVEKALERYTVREVK
jgi:hypothetical protein